MNLYSIFIHVHSGLRWLVLFFIVAAIINAVVKINKKSSQESFKDCVFNRLALIFMHLQVVLGFVLYFISPKVIFSAASMKNSMLRFFLLEHVILMFIAAVLITVGYIKAENASEEVKGFKRVIIYYSIALLLILLSIPWPFRGMGSGWF